ncbi:hypothetical protein Hanom_Chr16g01426481 [Helianthus anomalus]
MSSSFPFPQSAPPQVFDLSAYHPPAHMIAQAHDFSKPKFDSSVYFGMTPSITYTPLQPLFNTPQAHPQKGNQNPFRNQTITSTSNSLQTDGRCNWSVQCGGGDQGGTAFYAEIVKNINDGESSGNDDRSEYNGSTDEDGSGVSDYSSESDVKEGMDSEADNLSNDANEKSNLIKKVAAASKEMEKFLSEDGSFSCQADIPNNAAASTSQVKSETSSICTDCADMKH